jgi:hypothetical protein
MLAGIVLVAAYNGALVAVLSVPAVIPGIETLEQLAGQSQILWTTRAGTAFEPLFVVSALAIPSSLIPIENAVVYTHVY